MFDLSFKANIKQIQKTISDVAYKQVPYATAESLSTLAKMAADAEVKNMTEVLDNPTPFTLRSVGVKKARKDLPIATVYVKDIAAAYLEPYEFGGINKLNGRALLRPADIKVNQYGNLPKAKLAQLKARSDIFIGAITFKSSGQTINGVWQRNPVQRGTRRAGGFGTKGKHSVIGGVQSTLKLLIRFEDAHEVKQHLGWHALSARVINKNFNAVFGKALAKALATSK